MTIDEIKPVNEAKTIGRRYIEDKLPPMSVIKYPDSSVAPVEPRDAAMLMCDVTVPRLDFGATQPINEAQAGVTIEVANDCIVITRINCVGELTINNGSHSNAEKSPPNRIAGTYRPSRSLIEPHKTCVIFPNRFIRERSHPISVEEAPNWTAYTEI